MATTLERLEKFIHKGESCWNWLGALDTGGYGQFFVRGAKHRTAHNVVYETYVTKVPEGKVLNHLCKNRACVKPEHLVVSSIRDNAIDNDGPSGLNARKTHCIRGHPLSGENLYNFKSTNHFRICKECVRKSSREREREKRRIKKLTKLP